MERVGTTTLWLHCSRTMMQDSQSRSPIHREAKARTCPRTPKNEIRPSRQPMILGQLPALLSGILFISFGHTAFTFQSLDDCTLPCYSPSLKLFYATSICLTG